MAAAVDGSQSSAVDDTVNLAEQNPKSYREAVGGSKVSAAAESEPMQLDSTKDVKGREQEPDKTKDVKTNDSDSVKSKTAMKDRTVQDKTVPEKESSQEKDKGTVKRFDPKAYVEAPPPKTNPWKKSSSLDTPPPTPSQPLQPPSSRPQLSAGKTNNKQKKAITLEWTSLDLLQSSLCAGSGLLNR